MGIKAMEVPALGQPAIIPASQPFGSGSIDQMDVLPPSSVADLVITYPPGSREELAAIEQSEKALGLQVQNAGDAQPYVAAKTLSLQTESVQVGPSYVAVNPFAAKAQHQIVAPIDFVHLSSES